jgi:hypothetical protein
LPATASLLEVTRKRERETETDRERREKEKRAGYERLPTCPLTPPADEGGAEAEAVGHPHNREDMGDPTLLRTNELTMEDKDRSSSKLERGLLATKSLTLCVMRCVELWLFSTCLFLWRFRHSRQGRDRH